MPPAQCQAAATRGLSVLALLPLLFLLLISVRQTQAAIHIPEAYEIKTNLPQPPVITFQTESFTAFYLDDVSLHCTASGNPTPTYRWEKDGLLVGEENSTSGIFTAEPDVDLKMYQGQYRCYATNEFGTAVSAVIELITEAPPILPKGRRVVKAASEGESVVLNCNPPQSSVPPIIYWMDKKLLHIRQSERVTIGLDGNLYFANVLVNDSRDDYTCNAQYIPARTILPKEPISLIVSPSNLVVRNREPRLHRPEGKHTHYLALRGQDLTLECIPHGLPTPTVTWERMDGSLSSSHTTKESFDRRLVIENIRETDDGEYSCTANNIHGSVSHSYTITVEAAPYWTKEPQSQMYSPGETVRLDCQPEGIPTPHITWKINGTPIHGTPEPRRHIHGGTLILTNVRYNDTDVYQCEASNKHGTSLLNIYILVIELPPQILTEDKQVYQRTEGMTAFLHCTTFGSPRPQISWNDMDSESTGSVLSNPKMSQMTNGTLKITNVSLEDSGFYMCSVKDDELNITAQLEVLTRTRIVTPPQDLQVVQGDSAVLQCQYEVDMKLHGPTVQWRKNGHKVTSDTKHTVSKTGSLKIANVSSSDAGQYTCEVITKMDMDTATGYLTVVDKPDAPGTPQLSEIKPHSLTLSWTPGNDNNSPVYEYVILMREDLLLKEASWQELKRVSADVSHMEIPLVPYCTYHFRVAAVNEIGMSDFSPPSESHTTASTKPHVNPTEVRSLPTNPGSLVITWEEVEPRHFNGPGFQYKVSYRQTSGSDLHWKHKNISYPPLTLNDSGTFISYEIKVQSVNDVGVGPSPIPSIGHSGEDVPLEPPTGVTVTLINNTAFLVKWTAVSNESVRGHLLGYKIYLSRLGPSSSYDHSIRSKRSLGPVGEMGREVKQWMEVEVHGDKKEEIISGLEFFSDYELSVAAFNSKGAGPPSEPTHFSTPEGVPGPPSFLRFESPSETELTLFWSPPEKTNGILKGYNLQYQEFAESRPSELQSVTIDEKSVHFSLDNLDPQKHYFFLLRAFTAAGEGEILKVNGTTLLDGVPPQFVNMTIGETSVNLSWVPEDRQRNVGFEVHVNMAGRPRGEPEQVNSSQAFYQLQGLQPGTHYHLEIRLNNVTYWERKLKTRGPELEEMPNNFVSQGWFIGLISAVVLLLLILLILCIITRSKGGKYSVKAREEGQGDSEAKPMKDETFGEYRSLESDNDEKRSISQPSIVESKRNSDDSLAEYGDSVDIQFNEDGSFIGQYSGHKERQVDQYSSAAVSPINPNMPPPSMSFPTSVTGILGGN